MNNKGKIKELESQIKIIDITLYVLLILTLIELGLTIFKVVELNIISAGTIALTLILFRRHVKVRNLKETQMRCYIAMEDPDDYEIRFFE